MLKAFRTNARADEYVRMLQSAPFPNQNPDGYYVSAIDLS